ncbi:MAG: MYG1 family protein [Candidatus Microsaccharimonas sossegonensis]|uniref:MYG1 family protein n=1 Tax=Candidatus Microsaccharimonas sossegonensis TaxID=2506948 RepID=A0A4Q0AGF6_9BACT|nr:MAG: MYG1 family protein [Candidatus Microsaccharimonas sossegonensis]
MIIATHDGPFHADDVFGYVLLKSIFPTADFIRTRDTDKLAKADIVFDVGGVQDSTMKRFDHHVLSAAKRPNGVIYSAFGLLWNEYGLQYCDNDKDIHRRIDKELVEFIDADDNGQIIDTRTDFQALRPTIDELVRSFNPVDAESFDEQFIKASDIAEQILERFKKTILSKLTIEKSVIKSFELSSNKSFISIDHYIPVHDLRDMPGQLLYIVCQEKPDRWLLCTVQNNNSFDSLRKPLPQSWGGLSGEDFVRETGVEDVQSCHINRFIAVTYTEQAALELARQATQI